MSLDCSMSGASDAGEDVVGGFGPHERGRLLIVGVEKLHHRTLQFADAAMRATANLLIGELRKPTLHQIQPRAVGRGEVRMKAGPLGKPVPDRRSLVGAVVVHDDMDVEIRREVGFHVIEELAELHRAMPAMGLADNVGGLDLQSSKQRGGAVPPVVMGAALDLPGTHGQQRLGAVERLNLRFFVEAQHQGVLGRFDVQPHDVPNFSISRGSGDSLKVVPRGGWRPKAFQMRWTVMRLIPAATAIERVLQWVAPRGVDSSVRTITSSTCASATWRGAPGRGSSCSPSSRSLTKRARHLPTICGVTRSLCATVWLSTSSAHLRIIRARRAR